MPDRNRPEWRRLDNAAKIFPSTSYKSDTRVFRLSCEFTETVDPAALQAALEAALEVYPSFRSVMRRGFFWYYLERTEHIPAVIMEAEAPCARLYYGSKSPLLRMSYFENKINIELYHVLADGKGALEFLKEVIYQYLLYIHPDELGGYEKKTEDTASRHEKESDSFQKYYSKPPAGSADRSAPAYKLKSPRRDDYQLTLIEGVASAKALREAAKRSGAKMTVFLIALYIQSIYKTMYIRDYKRPVVIGVPVNLRQYFPSNTATNFFGMIAIDYNFSKQPDDLDSIIAAVSEQFTQKLTYEKLSRRMNAMAALEHNPFIRAFPLVIKDPILRAGKNISDSQTTSVMSNVGEIRLLPQYRPYVKHVGAFMSTLGLQMVFSSYEDSLSFGFTTAFNEAPVPREFFKSLVDMGVEVTVRSNSR